MLRRLSQDARFEIIAAVRGGKRLGTQVSRLHRVGDLGSNCNWSDALASVDVVVHTAARVHVMNASRDAASNAFQVANVLGTLDLARQAAQAGVKRFVFLSSIKVNGEATEPGHPFTAFDPPAPVDPYAISKCDAELQLLEYCANSSMDCTIIRPPLIYGPNVVANFRALVRWIQRGIPLPLAGIDNKRSFVALENLTDLVVKCLSHPAASNRTFLVSDDDDLSTPQLVRRIAALLGLRPRLFSLPVPVLRLAGNVLGMDDAASRLCGSLQVDIAMTRQVLDWRPPVAIDDALRATVESLFAEAAH